MTVTTTDPTIPEAVDTLRADATVPAAEAAPGTGDAALVDEDLLVEDVSIDGMCGVY